MLIVEADENMIVDNLKLDSTHDSNMWKFVLTDQLSQISESAGTINSKTGFKYLTDELT